MLDITSLLKQAAPDDTPIGVLREFIYREDWWKALAAAMPGLELRIEFVNGFDRPVADTMPLGEFRIRVEKANYKLRVVGNDGSGGAKARQPELVS